MRPEHVRLQAPERIFGEKNLLHAQLNIIALTQRYESYKALRAQELVLKIALKNALAEAQESLALLDRLLPKPAMVPKTPKLSPSLHEDEHQRKRKLTLAAEVEEIRRKLQALH